MPAPTGDPEARAAKLLLGFGECQMTDDVTAYLDHLRVARRLAEHTLASYGRDLAILGRYAAGRERPRAARDRADLEAAVRERVAGGAAPRSVARYVAAIRGFYRFLLLDRRLERSPADDLRAPRAWPGLPNYLSADDVDRLLAAPATATPRGLRDRASIELLYATGLRVSELVRLKVADVTLDQGFLTCVGKGSKERMVPVGDSAVDWVRRYLAGARGQILGPRTSPWLFVSGPRGTPLTRVGFWKLLKAHGPGAGIGGRLPPPALS